ncbi:MAG: Abc transporter related protein [Parcubacteria group bacterium GW2011_GWC2_48_17]|nr:MAG: Abc transporter related protein [Parcubacteria group bacterium GW2011_GWC2_48_17]
MSSLIETKNLSKTYRDESGVETEALRGVTLTIQEGEFVAIMGPSGSGKSTLLHILGFLDRESGGEYRFSGEKLSNLPDDKLAEIRNKKLGFVFQSFNLLPHFSVLQNVMLPLHYGDTPESEWRMKGERAVEAVRLSHRKDYPAVRLSGGEKQRVAIARALVTEPKVIFADEPTGNLDSKSGQAIMEILETLHARGHTIILITHETYTAEHANRIIRLKDGTVESDTKVERRRNAQEGFLK